MNSSQQNTSMLAPLGSVLPLCILLTVTTRLASFFIRRIGLLVDACVEVELPPDVVENTAHPLGSRAAARAAAIAAIAAQRLTGEASDPVSTNAGAGSGAQAQAGMASEAGAAAFDGGGKASAAGATTTALGGGSSGEDSTNGPPGGMAPVPCAVLRHVTGELRVRFTDLRLESSEDVKRPVKPAAPTTA